MKKFITTVGLPNDEKGIKSVLRRRGVEQITHFCLGPKGTNIGQAAEEWTRKVGLDYKTRIVFCQTPELSLEMAREADAKHGELGIFWTCAVYFRLYELFFSNSDTLPFFITHTMPLDAMQLATRPETAAKTNNLVSMDWLVASHSSPAPLMAGHKIKESHSNSAAALECSEGQVDACITTATSSREHKLKVIHVFGSPPMVFFGGITAAGVSLLRRVKAQKP